MSNWVERRATEAIRKAEEIREGGPQLYAELVGAIQRACFSYTTHYQHQARVEVKSQHECSVSRESPGNRFGSQLPLSVTLTFIPSEKRIALRYHDRSEAELRVEADKHKAFLIMLGPPLTIDEASEAILECVLFPDKTELPAQLT